MFADSIAVNCLHARDFFTTNQRTAPHVDMPNVADGGVRK